MGKVTITLAVDMEKYKTAQEIGFSGLYSIILETALEKLISSVGDDFAGLSKQEKRSVIREILLGGSNGGMVMDSVERQRQMDSVERQRQKEKVEVNRLVLEEYNNLW
ncbi:MAG: hypothetical protein QXG54_04830 [Desulfurococcaceae archaeon]